LETVSTNDFRTGLTIELDGDVYSVVEFLHVKPGKGSAFVRSKLRNVRTGAIAERTFRAGEKLPLARIDRRPMQYLYNTGDDYFFMDTETYEQMQLDKDILADNIKFMVENMNITLLMYNGDILGVELPNFVILEVTETEPGVKGDTAAGGSKPAKLETGLVVQVPFFIDVGDKLKIDTRSGEYLERV